MISSRPLEFSVLIGCGICIWSYTQIEHFSNKYLCIISEKLSILSSFYTNNISYSISYKNIVHCEKSTLQPKDIKYLTIALCSLTIAFGALNLLILSILHKQFKSNEPFCICNHPINYTFKSLLAPINRNFKSLNNQKSIATIS